MTITQTLTQESQSVLTNPVGKLSVYFCGGTGANLAERIRAMTPGFNKTGLADLFTYVIDTSESNLTNSSQRSNTFVYKGMDGFGKKRDEDPAAIKKKIPEILATFEPQEFNIVVASTAGGSGSTIAPFIVRELLLQGKSVIMLGVVSTDTETELKNTNKTLGNLETISQSLDRPVVLRTYLNPENGKQSVVDESIVLDILKLSMLFSRRNVRADQSDLRNWLNYNRIIEVPVKLVSLLIVSDSETKSNESILEEGLIPITVATVAPPDTSTRAPWPISYQSVGFVNSKNSVCDLKSAVHFTIVDGQIAALHKKLSSELQRLQASATGINFAKPVPVDRNDGMNDLFA